MTDTGQVPGEGQPENDGLVEQPGMPVPGAYTFLDPSENTPDEDDLLLMPGAQGAWTEPQPGVTPAPPVAVPAPVPAAPDPAAAPGLASVQAPVSGTPAGGVPVAGMPVGGPAVGEAAAVPGHAPTPAPVSAMPGAQAPAAAPAAVPSAEGLAPQPAPAAPEQFAQPEPMPQAPYDPLTGELPPQPQAVPYGMADAHEAGAHEAGGRDSVSVDLGAVRMPPPAQAATGPAAMAQPPRRPLHMGPPVPDATGGVVRSLADRGPATMAQPMAAPNPAPAPQGSPTVGPEYLDVPRDEAVAAVAAPGPQFADIPPQGAEPWSSVPVPPEPQQPQAPVATPAETVGPDTTGQFVPVEGPLPVPEHLAPVPVPPAGSPAPEEPAPRMPAGEGEAAAPEAASPEAAVPEPVAAPVGPEAAAAVQAVPAEPVAGEPVEAAPVAQQAAPVAQQAAPEQAAEQQAPEQAAQPVTAAPAEAPAAAPAAGTPAPGTPVTPQDPAVQPGLQPEPQPVAAQETAPTVPAPRDGGPTAEAPVPDAATAPEPVAAEAPGAVESPAVPQAAAAEPAPAPEVRPGPAATEETPAQAPEAGETVPPAAEAGADGAPAPVEAPEQPASGAEPAGVTGEPAADTAPLPPAPGYADDERETIMRVMRERRDIRNGFRSDPIPHEVLLRVLEAAHTAPSVGHSQPWDFVVIRSAETRRTMHELAQRQREAYAKSLPKGRAKQFKELKIEAILDTPVNIVVTADPTRGGRHTLGRHTQPQMAPYSSALAVENLWLAARAEGLGVGWVSFFDEREMVRTLGLPEHLEVVAYLCVGYVDEFPEEPELMQAGWSKRRPLSWVVHEETYGRRALPGEEPHDLLQETIANIRPLDAKALGEAWERQKRMTKPAGALGMLEIISAQLSGLSRTCPPPIPEPAAVAIFAGDHGVHAQGVTAWPQEVTGQMVANFLGGGAVCNAFATQVGAEVCVVDVGVAAELPATPGLLPRKVRPGTADFTAGPALTHEEVLAAIEVGIETARDLVAAGNKAILTGEMGIANTTASAAIISVYTGVDPAEVTGRGTGINDEMHARKVDVVRRALELHQPDPADPVGVLAAIGGLEHAAMVGFILGGASMRTPVLLDGVSAGAAALVARAVAPESLAACIAGHRSAEPGHVAALNKLGLRPMVDLDLRLGEGTGALLALPLVQSAARAMHEVATFDSAGVTEK
ncbi:nicotinate-nucleotide--dimethylbenzimidazole phosphoribosyltransferase [Streptomyces sp. MUM 203J]|uniref:nicotinate-nucleotide--dimethylbenzimidazole phosphoribosyltransferase n=1 Tax=Streptomyces sp. MUM 203J TaxID=2791990 RepID=UPI001F047153|nr:nicotinate-nucleotide--dimethylbenzimidazole phosphoribosyltransferase [Streptomyces sp. MUM 203J]MCH0540532.1 nicotinate-nucleotide--dimethylbenzimidazole phosphoribosyltransferase [Streptomyces sp. MUM 203J]